MAGCTNTEHELVDVSFRLVGWCDGVDLYLPITTLCNESYINESAKH